MTKFCGICGTRKPVEAFSLCSSTQDGLQTKCKVCAAAYYQANKKRFAKKRAKYLGEYYVENKPELLEGMNVWTSLNKEYVVAYQREYFKAHMAKQYE